MGTFTKEARGEELGVKEIGEALGEMSGCGAVGAELSDNCLGVPLGLPSGDAGDFSSDFCLGVK
jgi:hypothetical protein